MIHDLKTWPEHFRDVRAGIKTLGGNGMATCNLLRVEDRIYIHLGADEQDPVYQLAYDGLPNRIEIGEAEIVGTVELLPEQLEKIRAEYENGGYGDDIGPFDESDDSKKCAVCKRFFEEKQLLPLENGEWECENCAQVMSDLAP